MTWDINIVDIKDLQSPDCLQVYDFSAAIDKTFSYHTDFFTIKWNGVGLKFPFTYCLSDILDNLLDIIEELIRLESGEYYTGFLHEEEFDCDWQLNWNCDDLEIRADWRHGPLPVGERGENFCKCTVSKNYFLKSWGKLFEHCVKQVDEHPFEYENYNQILRIKKIIAHVNLLT
ncbi:hypothetical protein IV454_26680 [Massilia antarctica]|uniref:Uncharacterized protein n=1 Tax=Massilia antarctica TaxID=2765360 RepID=A0AA48WCI4_9BURK|nr:hypothetical protein [Massilia antarctica]QPI49027.1 hypothetical protein IV454_26680 [Massilia antarctica]